MSETPKSESAKIGFEDPQNQINDVDFVVHADQDKIVEEPQHQIATRRAASELELVARSNAESPSQPSTATPINYNEVAVAALAGCAMTILLMFQIDNQGLLLSNFALLIFAAARLHVLVGQATGQLYNVKAKTAVFGLVSAFIFPALIVGLLASFPQIARSLVTLVPSLSSVWAGGEYFLKWVIATPSLIIASLWLIEITTLINVNQPAKESPRSNMIVFVGFILLFGTGLTLCETTLWHYGVVALLNLGFGFQFLSMIFVCDALKGISPERLKARAIRMTQPNPRKVPSSKKA